MDFSNREIATGIIIAVGVILLIAFPKTRRTFFKGIAGVAEALFNWKLLLMFGLYFAYATLLVVLANAWGLWDTSLLSATILTILVTGFPIFMSANNYKSGAELVRKVVVEVVGISALLTAYLSLGDLPLWGELLLQIVIIPVAVLSVVAASTKDSKGVARFFEILLGLIGIGLIISTTAIVISTVGSLDWVHELKAFAVSVWLPIALIPFVYVAAFVMQVEASLTRLPFHNKRERPPVRVRWAFFLGLHGSLRYASRFSGIWLMEMASQRRFRDGLNVMRKFRKAVKVRVVEQRSRDHILRERKGQHGVDTEGLWLDRREFYATREVLDDMWFTQAAIYRNQKKFVNEPFLVSSFRRKDLPKEHGIEIVLSEDARFWYAWRKTAGGYVFAVGGTKDVDAKWRYDGQQPPSGFPRADVPGWVDTNIHDSSPEWATLKDQPIPQV
ncbi:hypothetical protein [Leucobacter aridicollis]|uniref:hypothetical protein n=1 Tax=Leucobacter aridicollis TaxID=283878 RepID=UPI002169D5D4|nr:hypothetical protein [Leucobacter aridicollis]MCS3427119.1 hypothetical protein [Leucobacter aridicollis]